MNKHTPTPWRVRRTIDGFAVLGSTPHRPGQYAATASSEADARLIAAAPDLLEALVEFVGHMDTLAAKGGTALYVPLDSGIVKTARAAIVKATQEA